MEASPRSPFYACLPLFFLLLSFCVSPASPYLNPFSECTQSRGRGASYRGSVDVTESGARCMNWSEVSGVTARYPGKGLGKHNFCRNPDGRIRPWCFFRNARGRVDWGYCDCKQGTPTSPSNTTRASTQCLPCNSLCIVKQESLRLDASFKPNMHQRWAAIK